MRPIKFRAWDEETETMYYSDQEYKDCFFGFNKGVVVAWLRQTEPQTRDEPAYDYGKPVDVMQYTGLKDKNGRGKKIWEGMGGIHPDYGKYVVKLGLYSNPDGKEHCGFYIEWQNKCSRKMLATRLPLWLTQNEMLFDMNIHENPELMSGEKE